MSASSHQNLETKPDKFNSIAKFLVIHLNRENFLFI